MHLVFILECYISRHVNYLKKGVVSHHHHLHPLLPGQLQGRLLDPPARSLVNVTILGQLQTVNGCSLRIPVANNKKIMRPVVNIKRYISRHVNYLGLVSQHHLHPLFLAVQYGQLPSPPPPSVVNVRVLCQLVQVAIDVSFPFLRPTTLPHKENVNYRQQSIAYNISEKDKVK